MNNTGFSCTNHSTHFMNYLGMYLIWDTLTFNYWHKGRLVERYEVMN